MSNEMDAQKKDEKILLASIQQEYKILAEYKMIESERLAGSYVIPSGANSLQWFGVFFGRQGFYENAVFRFSLLLPDRFPEDKSVPAIIFQHNVVHPLVCPYTHSLDISHAFQEWRCGEDHVWQVLKYMQAVFTDPLESIRNVATNELSNIEAAKVLGNSREAFAALVQECITENKSHIYDAPPTEDPHYIIFEQFQADVHGSVLDQIRSPIRNTAPSNESGGGGGGAATGLSWVKVKEGEFKPLSIE